MGYAQKCWYCGVLGSIALLVGCGGGGGRQSVSGMVRLKGVPVASGFIEFDPEDGRSQAGAEIREGQFLVAAARGLREGVYVVRISAAERKTNPGPSAPPGPENEGAVQQDLIPPKYNSNSELRVTVTADQANTFTFDLE